jgi:hypothetical protein
MHHTATQPNLTPTAPVCPFLDPHPASSQLLIFVAVIVLAAAGIILYFVVGKK